MFLRRKKVEPKPIVPEARSRFSTEDIGHRKAPSLALDEALGRTFTKDAKADMKQGITMDGSCGSLSRAYGRVASSLPIAQIEWYGNQSFIGYSICAMIAQHWLVDKACTMPARDAVRMGFKLNVVGQEDPDGILVNKIEKINKRMLLSNHLVEFERMSRVFGIRIAMFVVDSSDKKYYEKPYNPDGVTPNSYKGIVQVDPQWCIPQLDASALSDPSTIGFYEPTFWMIGTKLVHKSHLVINRTCELPDSLKATYRYGGIPVTQRIMERVYAAERVANEAPILAMTKRTDVIKTDVSVAMANRRAFEESMQQYIDDRDNFGVKVIDADDDMLRLDTSLTELDDVIMTQYQLVAAASGVPATKLLGTSPKGFNSSGGYEESSYHEELESIQTNHLQPLIERHIEMVVRSEVSPAAPFEVDISWNPADSPTEAEWADINLKRAQTGQVLAATGAIDGEDERSRIANDPDSGYSGLQPKDIAAEGEENPFGDLFGAEGESEQEVI
jgi:phage-related protein (TIGR01555 family)